MHPLRIIFNCTFLNGYGQIKHVTEIGFHLYILISSLLCKPCILQNIEVSKKGRKGVGSSQADRELCFLKIDHSKFNNLQVQKQLK